MNEFKEGGATLFAAVIGTIGGLLTLTVYSQGFFVGPVIQEFGWTPAQFYLSYTVMMCAGLITAPIAGTLAQKYGLRKLGMLGLVGHAIAYINISLNTGNYNYWLFSWVLLSVLAASSLPIIWTAGLNGFFKKHRGKAIGITMAGTGIGAFILPPLTDSLISGYGWRFAYQALGIGALVISLPVVFFFFRIKQEDDVDQETGPKESSKLWGVTRREALATPRYWILSAVLFITVFVIIGLVSNFKLIMGGEGLDGKTIAGTASILGIAVIIGRLGVGALVDRYWAPAVACVFFALPAFGMYLLLNIDITSTSAIIIAIFIGLAVGAELDMLAYLTGRYFGPRNYPEIFGGIYAAFTVGSGISPPIWGKFGRMNNGYDEILMIAIGLLFLCMVLFLMLGKYPEQSQAEVA